MIILVNVSLHLYLSPDGPLPDQTNGHNCALIVLSLSLMTRAFTILWTFPLLVRFITVFHLFHFETYGKKTEPTTNIFVGPLYNTITTIFLLLLYTLYISIRSRCTRVNTKDIGTFLTKKHHTTTTTAKTRIKDLTRK